MKLSRSTLTLALLAALVAPAAHAEVALDVIGGSEVSFEGLVQADFYNFDTDGIDYGADSATDLDGEAVNFARRGIYGQTSIASMPAALLDRYFIRTGNQFEIRKQIRALTVFGQHDLGQRAPFPRIDLAVARNVLIYFTPELQKRALQLVRVLAPRRRLPRTREG